MDSCIKWEGNLSNHPGYSFLANKDTNFFYEVILIENFKAIDRQSIRDGLFCDVCEDWMKMVIRAHDDAEEDYLRERHGKDFFESVRNFSNVLTKKFKIVYYDSIVPAIIRRSYKHVMISENVEGAILEKNIIDSLPFIMKVDTSYAKDYFIFKEEKSKFVFQATKPAYDNPYFKPMPAININIFFDPQKIHYPFTKYVFLSVLLE